MMSEGSSPSAYKYRPALSFTPLNTDPSIYSSRLGLAGTNIASRSSFNPLTSINTLNTSASVTKTPSRQSAAASPYDKFAHNITLNPNALVLSAAATPSRSVHAYSTLPQQGVSPSAAHLSNYKPYAGLTNRVQSTAEQSSYFQPKGHNSSNPSTIGPMDDTVNSSVSLQDSMIVSKGDTMPNGYSSYAHEALKASKHREDEDDVLVEPVARPPIKKVGRTVRDYSPDHDPNVMKVA